MTKPFFLLLVLILFALLAWVCLRFHAPMIESDLQNRVQATLFANGYHQTSVHASGRDLLIKGQVQNQVALNQVLGLAQNTKGARSIRHQLEFGAENPAQSTLQEAPLDPSLQLILTYEDHQLFMEGSFPDEASHLGFSHWVFAQIGEMDFQSKPTWQVQAPFDWPEAAKALALALFKMGAGEALLTPGKWQIEGKVQNASLRTEVSSILRQAMPPGYTGTPKLRLALSQELLQCQERLDRVVKEETLEFQSERADLEPSTHAFLDRIYQITQQCPNMQLRIAGHTDSSGDSTANIELSQARAKAVEAYLVSLGVPEENLTSIGLGSQFPLDDNASPQGRQKNRRIEFIVLEDRP